MVTYVLYLRKISSVRVISKWILREFWKKHNDSEEQLKAWFREADKGIWKNFTELKSYYPSASILENNRVVFNIKGNKYRLIIRINFKYQILWIRFIGTHAEYDKINANTI